MSAPSENANWHGYLLASRTDLPPPKCITAAEGTLARKDCGTGITASEYADSDEVLRVKAAVLAKMWINAQKPVIFSGAGISTSSGINDYASSAAKSVVQPKQPMSAMERMGLVWGWLQQNHDGLAQKAGFPPCKCNEIHGSWLDQEKNPIIAMSGNLRSDMFEWCLEMEKQSDFVFGVGTSYSGLNADRVSITTGKRHLKAFREAQKKTAGPTPSAILPAGSGQGLAILSLQKTPLDDIAALRIFSTIDHFMLIFAHQLCHVAALAMGGPARDFAIRVFSTFNIDVRNPDFAASRLMGPNLATVPYAPTPLPVGPPSNAQWLEEQKTLRKGWLVDGGDLSNINAALNLFISSPRGAGNKASATAAEKSVTARCPASVAASLVDQSYQAASMPPQNKVLQPDQAPFALVVGNTHTQRPDGNHDWCMYVKPLPQNSSTMLLRSVTYRLHPTFPDPVRTVHLEGHPSDFIFPLACSGWGTFTVGIILQFESKDPINARSIKTREVALTHELSFSSPNTSSHISVPPQLLEVV